ncbi:ferroxidase fet3, partial [Coemansia sp. RSA 552]
MASYLLLFVLVFFTAVLSAAERVELDWDITYVDGMRDGYNQRRSIGVNGQQPIPPVIVNHGDTLVLNVHNSLDVPTAIHAHGLFHNGTAYEDGAGSVTQCGIPPGGHYTYTIEAQQVGTYWIHGHERHQNSDGLRTPFIIRERCPPAQYDEEVLISLEDWYPTESSQKMEEMKEPTDTGVPPPSFPYGLINGYNGNETKPIKFVPGKRYRFRIVAMSTTEWWRFSIPGHKLEVIEADGAYSHPHVVDGLDMGPGQRYSAIVTAKDTDEFNFYYNATLYAEFVPRIPSMNPRHYKGLIEYRKGAPIKEAPPRQSDQDLVWADDINMQNLHDEAELPVDRQIEFTLLQVRTTENVNLRTMNVHPYTEPPVPSLFTAMTMGDLASNRDVYGPQAEAQVLQHLEFIEVRVNNPAGLVHSFHLHGHNFQVIEYGPVDPATIQIPEGLNIPDTPIPDIPLRRHKGSPMRRDTLVIPIFSYIKIRFRADNPG